MTMTLFKREPVIYFAFEPQPDITAFELAQCLALTWKYFATRAQMAETMSEQHFEVRRHFRSWEA